AIKDSTSDLDDLIRAVNAELALGRPDRAKLLLARRPASDERLEHERMVVGAFSAYAGADYAGAGDLFVGAADKTEGHDRSTLLARAGDAYSRAGKADQAAASFRQAREGLPEIAGWLALREAQVTRDTTAAFGLLDKAPAAARRLIPRVRGDLFALVGDTARAVVILAGAGHDARAATLALASADTFNARQLTYRGLRSGDSTITNAAIQLATTALPPRLPEEFITLARAVRRQSPGRAAALLGGAVAAGDSSSRTLALWGDVLTETGSHEAALQAYTRAAHAGGPEAIAAEFSQGRA